VQIRKLDQGDLASCAELFASVFSQPPWSEPWAAKNAADRLRYFLESPGFIGFVAVRQERLVGFVLGNTEPFHTRDMFYLREMCVSPDFQDSGIGGILLEQLESLLALQSIAAIYLITERATLAARFYLKHGYSNSESTGFYAKQLNEGNDVGG
jgi:ribosomal protein S18 acetylase RimI-like enzyme